MSIDLEPEDSPLDAAIEAGWINPIDVSKAMLDVMNERDRQWNEEHFDPAHDDKHSEGELAAAAACYAQVAAQQARLVDMGAPPEVVWAAVSATRSRVWPWERSWWKPKDARRNLVRAAALLVAEIDRLDRAAARAGQS